MRACLKALGFITSFALGFYILAVAGLYLFQRELLFVRNAGADIAPLAAGVPYATVLHVTTADGLRLYGWYVPPDKAGYPVVVFFNGQSGLVSHLAGHMELFHREGYGVLIASYRGYGDNPGAPSEDGIYQDARAFISSVEEMHLPYVFYGISMGTGVAVKMAAEFTPQAVILQSPYSSIASVAASRFPFAPVNWLIKDRFDSISRIAEVKAAVLMIMGREDTVIPPAEAGRLFEAAPEPKQMLWLDKRGHNNILWADIGPSIFAFLTRGTHENPPQ